MLLSALTGERLTPLRLAVWADDCGVDCGGARRAGTGGANQIDEQMQPAKGLGVNWAIFSAVCFGVMFWLLGLRVVPLLGSLLQCGLSG